MISKEQLDNWFTYHAPTTGDTGTISKYMKIRSAARTLADIIVSTTPESAEQAEALTKLRETMMWANSAIACNSK